jgi:hypothetical protein
MADDKNKIKKELQEEINKLNKETAKTYQEQLKALNSINASSSAYKQLLSDVRDTVEDLNQGFSGVYDEVKNIVNELGRGSKSIKDSTQAMNGLESIVSKLKSDQKGYTDLNLKQLKQEKSKLQIYQEQIKAAAERLTKEKGIANLANENLSLRRDLTAEEIAVLRAAQDNFAVFDRTNNLLNQRLEEEIKYRKALGVTGALLTGISKIPILGELVNAEEALEAAREKAKAGGNAIQVMGAAFGSMGKSLLTSLTDPLTIIGLLVKGFQKLVEIGFAADQQVTDLSKSMAVSKEEAIGVRDRMVEIQNSSENVLMTTKSQVEAQLELADAFGVTRGFTEQQVEDQVNLTKAMKLSAEEAAGIQQLALANGKSVDDVTGAVIKQTASLAKQKGIQLDNKKVLGEVAKVSGQLRLQYQNNPELIAKAVVQSNKLGISLDQAKKAAEGLLNIEESIENELSAELLTGKSLNLERARGLALQGDSAGAAEEMLRQVGSAADFAKMNVIQQEALAKSVGMTSDELANSLVQQENLNALGEQTKQQIQERVEELKAQGRVDEANKLMASIGNEKEAQAALKRISDQDRFNAAMEKLQATVTSIVEGPAMKLVEMIASLASNAKALKLIFAGIGAVIAGISLVKLVSGLTSALVQAGLLAATTATTASAITLGVGAVAVAAGVIAIMAALASAKSEAKVNDGFFPAVGGSGYGKRTLLGPEGAIQLNNKDTVIAGTDLFGSKSSKGDDVMSAPQGGIKLTGGSGGNDSSAVVNAISQLRNDINALASRPINVSVDGKKIIEATTGANPNEDGDAMRKNSYKVQ